MENQPTPAHEHSEEAQRNVAMETVANGAQAIVHVCSQMLEPLAKLVGTGNAKAALDAIVQSTDTLMGQAMGKYKQEQRSQLVLPDSMKKH